jgi:alpha-2-macroglobulin
MVTKKSLRVFHAAIIFVILFSSAGCREKATTAPTSTSTVTVTGTSTATKKYPTVTPLPGQRGGGTGLQPTKTPGPEPTEARTPKPPANVEESVDLNKFPPKGPFIVDFLQPMDPGSSKIPLLSFPYIAGTVSWNSSKTQLSFLPDSPLDNSRSYTFFLDPAIQTASGSLLETNPQWQVTVDKGPSVESISPAPGKLTSNVTTIEVTFDRNIDPATVEPNLTIEPPIPFEIKWNDFQTIVIELAHSMQIGQHYDFILKKGESSTSLLDRNEVTMAVDYLWSYWLNPLEAVVQVVDAKTLAVDFNFPVDVEKTGTPFQIQPALKGQWEWPTAKKAVFKADNPIPYAAIYTLSVTGELFFEGGPLTLPQDTYLFSAIPPVKAEFDLDKYSLTVSTEYSPLEVQFDVAVDHASAENAFSITPAVDGYFEWNEKPKKGIEVLQFYPDQSLEMNTNYTMSIASSVVDKHGNKILTEAFAYQFQTGYNYYYGGPTFGELGMKVQVVDANGWRKIQFGAGDSNLRFDLYAYDLNEFVQLYSKTYANWAGYYYSSSTITLPENDKTPAASWGYEYKPYDVHGGNNSYEDISETVIPDEVKPGLYILDMVHDGHIVDHLFVSLTTNTIMAKQTTDEIFVWVSDINAPSSNSKISGIEVRLYSSRGEMINESTTDETGILTLKRPADYKPLILSARVYNPDGSEDISIVGLTSPWSTISSGIWNRARSYLGRGKYLGYVYTDRPIYRPGQLVNYKVIVRQDQDVQYLLMPTGTPVTVSIHDSRNNIVQTFQLNTNAFGSVNGTFQIGPEAAVGTYSVKAVINGEEHSVSFKVEEYRKPDFQVSLVPQDPNPSNKYVVGEEVKLHISANYFFGEPVSGANYTITTYESADYYCYYCGGDNWMVTDGVKFTSDKGELNADGSVDITFTPGPGEGWNEPYYSDWRSSKKSTTYAIEVRVDNGGNLPVTGSYVFSAYSAQAIISLDNGGYVQNPGKSFTVQAKAVDLQGNPIADQKMELEVYDWNNTSYYFSENKFESYSLTTGSLGQATQSLTLPSGIYDLVIKGEDALGNEMTHDTWVYVFSSPDEWWVRTQTKVRITADKTTYKPYENATLLIESEFSGPAQLTFERGSVIHHMPIVLNAPLTTVKTMVLPDYFPNVYISVNAWQPSPNQDDEPYDDNWYGSNRPDSHLRLASTEIQVEDESKKLQVQIITDQSTYGPGQPMEVTIAVSNSSGKPVRAEVSLALVDEAIYSLSAELAPSIFNAFYSPRFNSVGTYDSMSPDRIIFAGGFGSGGDPGPGPAGPRQNFQDVAAWFPDLLTDSTGKVKVTLTLPDNLTSWRLTAKAFTLNNLVGEAITNVETKKDLIIQPILPRILTSGDNVQLTALVQNFGDQPRKVEVSMAGSGLTVNGEVTRSVLVEVDQTIPLTWDVNVLTNTDSQIDFKAVAEDGASDSVQLTLPVQPAAAPNINSLAGDFSQELNLIIPMPGGIVPETSQVLLQLNSDTSGTILSGLEYLTGYPYGCVEQTMSRALPNAVVSRADRVLNLDPALKKKMDPLIQASLQKLYNLHHPDGGWGWWWDDPSDDYQTAWVLFGLALISDAGYSVNQNVIDDAAKYLHARLDEMDERTQAYALYSLALAGKGSLEETKAFADASMYGLDSFSQAALALALEKNGDHQAAKYLLDRIGKQAVRQGQQVYWPQGVGDGEYHKKTMASSVRTTALILDAYVVIQPSSDLIPGITKYLLSSRHGLSGWGSTNETSYAIIALTDYLFLQRDIAVNASVLIELNGETLFDGIIDKQSGSLDTVLPLDKLEYGPNGLKVTSNTSTALYYNLSIKYDVPQTIIAPAGPIQITRRYLDATSGRLLDHLAKGQIVEVQLTINNPTDSDYMIIEDHLPGGLEAINDRLNSLPPRSTYGDSWEYYLEWYWEDLGYNYKDVHDDQVDFFVTHLKSGKTVFTYLARATFSGEFTALPVEVYAMYDPTSWGHSASSTIVIRK